MNFDFHAVVNLRKRRFRFFRSKQVCVQIIQTSSTSVSSTSQGLIEASLPSLSRVELDRIRVVGEGVVYYSQGEHIRRSSHYIWRRGEAWLRSRLRKREDESRVELNFHSAMTERIKVGLSVVDASQRVVGSV